MSPLGLAPLRNQARPFQHSEMFGYRWQCHLERLCQIRHRALPIQEPGQNRPPGGIRKGRKSHAELICHIFIKPYG
jgi:hypothetical protein